MLKSYLCKYTEAYKLVKRAIKVVEQRTYAAAIAAGGNNINVISKKTCCNVDA